MSIRQVYGFVFDALGRVLMRVDGDKHNLPGGRPEPADANIYETLKRECVEEVNITIDDPVYLGFQCVDEEDGTAPYAQLRMIARVREIGLPRPDPDTGRLYRRLFTSTTRAGHLLNWGSLGHQQTSAATALAAKALGILPLDESADAFI